MMDEKKKISRENCIVNMLTAAAVTLGVLLFINITPASSMSGAMKTLRGKGSISTKENESITFRYSRDSVLTELDYLSLARLSTHRRVIIIEE